MGSPLATPPTTLTSSLSAGRRSVTVGNVDEVIFYWPQEKCENTGGEALPSNIRDISCQKECDKGEYLAFNREVSEVACMKCPANTYSLGGGMRIDGALQEWSQTDIYSEMLEGGCAWADYRFSDYNLINYCSGWEQKGKYLETQLPPDSKGDVFYDLWFKLGVHTVKPGSVREAEARSASNLKRIPSRDTWASSATECSAL